MASLPLILSLADDLDRLSTAAAVSPYYHHRYALQPSVPSHYYRLPGCSWLNRLEHDANAAVAAAYKSPIGKDGFQVCMDVAQFKPSELNVKVVDNNIVVEGKHEEREDDHGYISRHFVRRYALPKGYESEKVVSTLSSDGVLTVSVPKPPQLEDKSKNERVVAIQQTGPAHLNVKENSKEGDAVEESKK